MGVLDRHDAELRLVCHYHGENRLHIAAGDGLKTPPLPLPLPLLPSVLRQLQWVLQVLVQIALLLLLLCRDFNVVGWATDEQVVLHTVHTIAHAVPHCLD